MLGIKDAHLPGLADLTQARLRVITGADAVDILRLRYRVGKRAILHIETHTGVTRNEGSLWFFSGDKAGRVARRNKKSARFDPQTQALFEAFPDDHRMPQIRTFLDGFAGIIPDLTGHEANGRPQLLRYRPGLSCTFRCPLRDHPPAFVKLVNNDDPTRLSASNRVMQLALAGSGISVAGALGVDLRIGAIVYEVATGNPLDTALAQASNLSELTQAISGLRSFWDAPIRSERQMGPDQLLMRARESAEFITATAPACAGAATDIVAKLEKRVPICALRPIHGDMKLEHLFLDGPRVTLIDTESVSMGLPDYDLAQLYGRLWQTEFEGHLSRQVAGEGSAMVRAAAGPHFDWCLGVVAVRLAKYYAQRPTPGMARSIMAILERLR